MGCCSTLDITRKDALAEIMRHLFDADDEKIATVLYDLVGYDRCYNFCIVSEYNEDSRNYSPGILQ